MKKLLPITLQNSPERSPLYLQLESEIIQLICKGKLKPGELLPPSRALASSLGLNRKTVLKAYEELDAQGWVERKDRIGVYVSSLLPPSSNMDEQADKDKVLISKKPNYHLLNPAATIGGSTMPLTKGGGYQANIKQLTIDDGFPDPRLVPVSEFAREYRQFGKSRLAAKLLNYGPEHGSLNLRKELAGFLNKTRGMQVTEKEILITKGTQMGLYLAAQLLIAPGDHVFVPEPGYHAANQTFLLSGAQLTFIDIDEDGMDVDQIEKYCKTDRIPKMVFIIPHHHRPTTVTLSPKRRMRLMHLARKYKFAIVEDDYDYDYHYTGSSLLPMASIDTDGNIIYIGSFCKTIAPAVRIGFMVAPELVVKRAAAIRKLIDRQGEQLLEEAMAALLHSGVIGRHIKKSFKLYQARLDHTCRLLRDQLGDFLSFERPHGGLAIWAKYKEGISAKKVALKAEALGLQISSGSNYYFQTAHPMADSHIRIGYCSLDEKEMTEAVKRWKMALMSIND